MPEVTGVNANATSLLTAVRMFVSIVCTLCMDPNILSLLIMLTLRHMQFLTHSAPAIHIVHIISQLQIPGCGDY